MNSLDIVIERFAKTEQHAKVIFLTWRARFIDRIMEECNYMQWKELDRPNANSDKDWSNTTLELVDNVMPYQSLSGDEKKKKKKKGITSLRKRSTE